jgi:hypothetical protein
MDTINASTFRANVTRHLQDNSHCNFTDEGNLAPHQLPPRGFNPDQVRIHLSHTHSMLGHLHLPTPHPSRRALKMPGAHEAPQSLESSDMAPPRSTAERRSLQATTDLYNLTNVIVEIDINADESTSSLMTLVLDEFCTMLQRNQREFSAGLVSCTSNVTQVVLPGPSLPPPVPALQIGESVPDAQTAQTAPGGPPSCSNCFTTLQAERLSNVATVAAESSIGIMIATNVASGVIAAMQGNAAGSSMGGAYLMLHHAQNLKSQVHTDGYHPPANSQTREVRPLPAANPPARCVPRRCSTSRCPKPSPHSEPSSTGRVST